MSTGAAVELRRVTGEWVSATGGDVLILPGAQWFQLSFSDRVLILPADL